MSSFFKQLPLVSILCLSLSCSLVEESAAATSPRAEFKTNLGSFVIELYPDKAPKTVANFIQYVDEGFYAGTTFHRVISRRIGREGSGCMFAGSPFTIFVTLAMRG
ncbi:MAG: hypothetical protein EBV89_06785 [Betaproteobacteria bacterium]|nr:hypothetical protein [Betaproteobacteria bacterium]